MGSGDPYLFRGHVPVSNASERMAVRYFRKAPFQAPELLAEGKPSPDSPPSYLSSGTKTHLHFKIGQWEYQKGSRQVRDQKSFLHFLIYALLSDSGVNERGKGTPIMVLTDFLATSERVEVALSRQKENKDNKISWTSECGSLRFISSAP